MFLTGLFIGMFLGFYGLDGVNIAKNEIQDRYRRFRSLNKLVATQYKNLGMIVMISVQLIFKALWLSFLQWINTSVIPLKDDMFEVSYVIKGRVYKMIIQPVNGPSPILIAISESNDDVTSHINPYLGPRHDFHGTKFTPEFFGYTTLTLELSSGEDRTFDKEDVLCVKEDNLSCSDKI